MTKERNKATPAVYLFLRKGEEILLGRRQNSGYYDGWYSVPAGHVEFGELPVGGLIREMKEELDIVVNPKDLRLVQTMYRAKHDETGERLDLFFETEKWSEEVKINEPHKCDDLRWFPVKELPENMMHHVKIALENAKKGVLYSEIDLEHDFKIPSK